MSEVPTPVTESTAIEIVRKEGTAVSYKSVDNGIAAGDLCYFANSSGISKIVGGSSGGISAFAGISLAAIASGNRGTLIKGRVRARWDGATVGALGTPIAGSTARSGYFETSTAAQSGTNLVLGSYTDKLIGTLAAANSGALVEVTI